MLNLSSNQQQNSGAALNLSLSGAPTGQGLGGAQANPWQQGGIAAAGQNPFMQGITNGQSQQWGQQAVQPPSELEINMLLLQSLTPVESFVAGANMGVIIELFSSVVTHSVMEILRNATFIMNDDEGTLKMDLTTLPQHLQTVSGENVAAQFNALQSNCNAAVTNGAQTRQQITTLAQQSMMGGALSAAMANDGLMEKMGTASGSFLGRVLGTR